MNGGLPAQSVASTTSSPAMPHLVLLGDSVIDNGAYTGDGPAVIAQVQQALRPGWTATLRAVDGSTTADIGAQLDNLPGDTTHLLLSVGGNDALARADLLDTPVNDSGEALMLVAAATAGFEQAYRAVVQACLACGAALVVCTIYHGNFPDEDFRQRAAVALGAFNDVIIRTAIAHALPVLDLRAICSSPDDYANPIEPSSTGGAKIAAAIVRAVADTPRPARGALLLAD
jgi:hypothetical protein